MPTDLPIVLHVGGPKAGSSALQYDLTWNPRRPACDRPGVAYEYVALNARGQLRRGQGLEEMASRFAAHYANSAAIESLLQLPRARLEACVGELRAMRRDGIVPIMSYELWLHAEPSLVERFTELLQAPLEVVAYVRDPVSWLTSAYWQRHQAEASSIDEWLEALLPLTRWADHLAVWQAQPAVRRLTVRLMEGSVAADFCSVLGCAPSPADVRHNVAFPGPFARFLTRHTMPESVSMSELKFAWWRWVSAIDYGEARVRAMGGLPRVIGQPQLDAIIDATAAASERLLDRCDAATADRIRRDRRWWSRDAAHHRLGEPAAGADREASGEADELLALTLQATMAADSAWRKVTHELAELRPREALLEHRVRELEALLDRRAHEHEAVLMHRTLELQREASIAEHRRQEVEHQCLALDHRCKDLEFRLHAARQRVDKLERRGCLPHPWRKAA